MAPDGSPYEPTAHPPLEFPPAQPLPCARITTRVFHPKRNQVATVQNVLVRTDSVAAAAAGGGDDVSWSSDDSSTSSDASMEDATGGRPPTQPSQSSQQQQQQSPQEIRAYWVQRTVREAIYGRVLLAVVLRQRTPSEAANDNAEWEVTDHHCAVKEMSWQHIRKERDRLAEDPIKEVSAMQYLKKWHAMATQHSQANVVQSFQAILETNIMMPLDLLTDDRHLYSVMPYCDGGELFERLDLNERFPEAEARYWMFQVLNVGESRKQKRRSKVLLQSFFISYYDCDSFQGLENLQNAGITHRDMSLENLLVHQSGALIIDMGMCLRVPFQEEVSGLSTSFGNMTMNGTPNPSTSPPQSVGLARRSRPRHLIVPQGTCGKWIYMSPEIYKNQKAFDGFAVDMWAAGVILFLMLTGFPPWERACQTDERFRYMTAGYLVQMLTEWDLGLSSDAMDLLQRMLFLDPKDRLSLDQVRAHPWMVNGPMQPPLSNPGQTF